MQTVNRPPKMFFTIKKIQKGTGRKPPSAAVPFSCQYSFGRRSGRVLQAVGAAPVKAAKVTLSK